MAKAHLRFAGTPPAREIAARTAEPRRFEKRAYFRQAPKTRRCREAIFASNQREREIRNPRTAQDRVINRFGGFALLGCKTASSGRGSVGRRLIREGLPSRDHRERLP